jgi:glycosyltransferase involved in cell wall biosynthesis
MLEHAWRALGRLFGVVVVGPALARHYAGARRLLPIAISLISERDIAPPELAEGRDYGGDLVALSVGRLDAEKNPLLLADVLARLGPRWKLVVVGSGPMEEELRARIEELGLSGRADLRGYVNDHAELMELYRSSQALLHCSWTEGVPQVLFEAFAARLPIVATAVGGVPDAAGDAALLVPPGDADAPAAALERIAAEPELRRRLTDAGALKAADNSFEASTGRVADFLTAGSRPSGSGRGRR